jgi:hypothetical protein
MPFHGFSWLTTAVPIAVQFVLFLRWLHRRMRNEEMVRACVRDIALNHLPHIYASLRAIAARQGITVPENPVVHFVDFNGRRHSG